MASAAWAGTFGRVVQIGGHASDISLDERRGLLYIANFTANRIEVMSTSDYSLRGPIHVADQPASLALSPDGRYLVVAHDAKWTPPFTATPSLTILNLDAGSSTSLAMEESPLAVAFGSGPLALVVTEAGFKVLNPATGILSQLQATTIGSLPLPVDFATFPPQITQASMGVSGDGRVIIGVAAVDANDLTSTLHFSYNTESGELLVGAMTSAPSLGPRLVSVNRDGSKFLAGWALLDPNIVLWAQFPNPTGDLNIGSHAFDWSRSLVYAQIPEATAGAQGGATTASPVLHIFDSDNLTVRERLQLAENLTGKSLLSSDMNTMYSVSDSGVTVLPVGSLSNVHRVTASKEDVLFRGNFCDRGVIEQEMDIVDPGGGNTDFKLSSSLSGVTVSPASGTTPTRVTITVDLKAFQNLKGTTAAQIAITSQAGVNLPAPVRVLINTREPEQRGALTNVPGKLVDVLADPVRNRVYIIRQDKNQVLVYEGESFSLLTTLRTGNTPTQMAVTRDNRYLIVGNDNSQIANVYDLDQLTESDPILLPFGHYPRSVAVSNRAILIAVRGVSPGDGCPGGTGTHTIDRVNFATRSAVTLPSLGVYCNSISEETLLAAAPSGNKILAVSSNGNTLLYEADSDTFVASRQDFTKLGGAYAALNDYTFVADNNILNLSLVPYGQVQTPAGSGSGFIIFVDSFGIRTTAVSSSSPGVIARVNMDSMEVIRPTQLIEAPLLVQSMLASPIGQIGETILPLMRTLALMSTNSTIVSLGTSGLTVLPWNYDAALQKPSIQSITNLADGTTAIAPGSLITVQGSGFALSTVTNHELPVPTTLGEACLMINNTLAPLFLVGPGQITAQSPYEVSGSATAVVRTAGGTSGPFTFATAATAPAVFHAASAGPDTGLPTVFRTVNQDLVTLSNPVHPNDFLIIYLTGLGATSPPVATGAAAPLDPLAIAVGQPVISLGGVPLYTVYAGLVPGLAGVYQVNVFVPSYVPLGMSVPLVIRRAGGDVSMSVRVVR
jgi:uncharacterized protein (TIGR03437 family)